MQIKKSRTAKVIAGFVSFATAVTMSFGTASAATTAELQAQIASLLATIQGLQTQLNSQGGATTGGVSYTFTQNLKLGSTGTEVLNLQKVLNGDPATQIATTGAGAPGSESTYFGAKTKAAVIKFQEKYAAEILTPIGLTAGTGTVGAATRAKLNTMTAGTGTGTGTTVPVGTGTTLGVMLSSDTPVSGTLVEEQAVGDLAHYTFTNPTATEAKVTNLVFNRIGVSNDATLVNVYLFKGATRVTDSASVSMTKITFNDASGLFTIPAGGVVTIAVKADIADATSGQIVGVAIANVTSSVTASGTFPIAGNLFTIAAATIASAEFSASVTPAAADIDPQDGYTLWSNSVVIGQRAVNLSAVTFRHIGSAAIGDAVNFKLLVDGTQVGTTVASMDANGYITFALPTVQRLETGTHTFKVLGDVIGGTTKTIKLSLQQAGDIVLIDTQLNQPILVKNTSAASFSAKTAGAQTIQQGSLIITKKTDSPSGNVTANSSNVTLAKFEFKATGEPMKIESLDVAINTSDNNNDYALRSGALYANGIQVGNTTDIPSENDSPAYVRFNLGSSMIVTPGTPVVLEVKGDIYDNAGGTNAAVNGQTIQVRLLVGDGNYKKTKSLEYANTAAKDANELTIAVGGLTMSKNASYANQTIVVPQTAYKIASYNLVTSDTEAINLDTLVIGLDGSTGEAASDFSDLYVKYGSKTTSPKATVSIGAGGNTFNISEQVPANTTLPIEVYATLNSGMSATIVMASSTITGTTVSSAAAKAVGGVAGQNITVSTGDISAAKVSDSALGSKILVGNTSPKVASFRITALNDTYSVTDIALKVGSTEAAGSINTLTLKSAGMTDKIVTLNGLIATTSGLTLSVPANDSNGTVVDVYLNLNAVAANAATSSVNVNVTLDTIKAVASTGEIAWRGTDVDYGVELYAFKTIPTITLSTLPSTVLQAGSAKLMKFTVAADSAGQLTWNKMKFTIGKSASVDISDPHLYRSNGTEVLGTFATSSGTTIGSSLLFVAGATTGGDMTFIATDEEGVTTSDTYELRVTIGGTLGSGKYVSTSIGNAAGATHTRSNTYAVIAGAVGAGASFVWSDRSSNSHSTATADWNDSFLVKNLPTDTQTLNGVT